MSFHEKYGLTPVINAAGPLTVLGAAPVRPEVIQTAVEVLPEFVEIRELQRLASRAIAEATGAEAGCVTACAASGIAIAVAAAMTGPDLARIERLPDTTGMKNRVVIQKGQVIKFEARVDQIIRMTGAVPVEVGTVRDCEPWALEYALTSAPTAAVVYVVSHALRDLGGLLPLPAVTRIAHAHGVPVIVDAASEYDLRRHIAEGADIAIYSGHKALGGLTAGIVAGRKDLVRAAYLQWKGIGRTMKVGKEGIAGVITALRLYQNLDWPRIRQEQIVRLEMIQAQLAGLPGIEPRLDPDPTGNPITRLQVNVDPAVSPLAAWELAAELRKGVPPIRVRDWNAPAGYITLDASYLTPEQAVEVGRRIREIVTAARQQGRRAAPYLGPGGHPCSGSPASISPSSAADSAADEELLWPDV